MRAQRAAEALRQLSSCCTAARRCAVMCAASGALRQLSSNAVLSTEVVVQHRTRFASWAAAQWSDVSKLLRAPAGSCGICVPCDRVQQLVPGAAFSVCTRCASPALLQCAGGRSDHHMHHAKPRCATRCAGIMSQQGGWFGVVPAVAAREPVKMPHMLSSWLGERANGCIIN